MRVRLLLAILNSRDVSAKSFRTSPILSSVSNIEQG